MKTTHTHKGHCQRCGRLQAASNGSNYIAKHGYKVAGFGFFNGTCTGSDCLALEIARDLADLTVLDARQYATAMRAIIGRLTRGTTTPKLVTTDKYIPADYGSGRIRLPLPGTGCYEQVPYEQGTEKQQKAAQAQAIAAADFEARAADSHADYMVALIAKVHGAPLVANNPLAPVSFDTGRKFLEGGVEWTIVTVRHCYGGERVSCTRTYDGKTFDLSAVRVRKAIRAQAAA